MFAGMTERLPAVGPLQLPTPQYPSSHLAGRQPISPVSLPATPTTGQDKMCLDTVTHHDNYNNSNKPIQTQDMEIASTLASMTARRNTTTTTDQPASPAWSHSSVASDSVNESVRSGSFVFTDGASAWPSPLPQFSASSPFSGSFSSSFSSSCSDKSLPRLPELDNISLESLASHYASSSKGVERSPVQPRPSHDSTSSSPLRPEYHAAPTHNTTPLPPISLPPSATPAPLTPSSSSSFHPSSYSPHVNSNPTTAPNAFSPASSGAATFHLKPKRKPPTRGTRCNVKYTIEQKDFIDYWRIDRHDRETPWDDVTREFNCQFRGPHRGNGGLQSAYYRENKKIPIVDDEGLLLFEENDELRTTEVPVREAKSRLHSVRAIGLLSSHPERAIEYSWVSGEHKQKVWKIGHARRAQLQAAASRQRRRAEVENRMTKAQQDFGAGISSEQAAAPEVEPFEAPLLRSRAMMSRI